MSSRERTNCANILPKIQIPGAHSTDELSCTNCTERDPGFYSHSLLTDRTLCTTESVLHPPVLRLSTSHTPAVLGELGGVWREVHHQTRGPQVGLRLRTDPFAFVCSGSFLWCGGWLVRLKFSYNTNPSSGRTGLTSLGLPLGCSQGVGETFPEI